MTTPFPAPSAVATVTRYVTPSPSPTITQLITTPAKHGVDWGNVPTWVGAILTSGTLLLGVMLFLRDRWRQRRAQASQVALHAVQNTEHSYESGVTTRTEVIWVYNASDNVILHPTIRVKPDPRKEHRSYYAQAHNDALWQDDITLHPEAWSLDPKTRQLFIIDLDTDETIRYQFTLGFTDATGTSWTRDSSSLTLSRHKFMMTRRNYRRFNAWRERKRK